VTAPNTHPNHTAKHSRRLTRTTAARIGLVAWPAAILLYILHTTAVAFTSWRAFDLMSIWLLVIGSTSLHTIALHGPARWFSPKVLSLLAAASGACALLCSITVAVGRIDPTPSDLLVCLLLLLAPAAVGVNAAGALNAMTQGADHPSSEIAGDKELLAALELLDGLSPEQAAACIRALQAVLAARTTRDRHTALHVVHTWDSMNGSGAHKHS
jgi:hypothetical protein